MVIYGAMLAIAVEWWMESYDFPVENYGLQGVKGFKGQQVHSPLWQMPTRVSATEANQPNPGSKVWRLGLNFLATRKFDGWSSSLAKQQ